MIAFTEHLFDRHEGRQAHQARDTNETAIDPVGTEELEEPSRRGQHIEHARADAAPFEIRQEQCPLAIVERASRDVHVDCRVTMSS